MISFDFLKWRSMGPQKLATIIGDKYSIFKPSKKIKVFFYHKNYANYSFKNKFQFFQFFGVMNFKNCVYIS